LLLQYGLPAIIPDFPSINYFVRAMFVILIAFLILAIPTIYKNGIGEPKKWFVFADAQMKKIALGLLFSLVILHIIFH